MANPAFVMIGDQFEGDGEFGTAPFGTAPFGGGGYNPYVLPTYHLGSNDLQRQYRRTASEIVQYRDGIPVAVRPIATLPKWTVNFKVIPEDDLDPVGEFFDARVFRLLPNGNPAEYIRVHVLTAEFNPQYVKPGVYSLAFEIQEFPE